MKLISFCYQHIPVRCAYTEKELPWLFVEDVVQCVDIPGFIKIRSRLPKKDVQDIVLRGIRDAVFTIVRNDALYELLAFADPRKARRFVLWYAAKVLPSVADMLETQKDRDNSKLLTPTELAPLLGLNTAQEVNQCLQSNGLQTLANKSDIGYTWHPTELGNAYGRLVDTGLRKHGGSEPVLHLKWEEAVAPLIHRLNNSAEGAG